jgi:hypothetical protein
MKTTRILGLLTAFTITLIVSCKKSDQLQITEDQRTIVLVSGVSTLPDCSTNCIQAEGPYIEGSGSQTQTWGNPSNPHSKTVDWVVYNTSTSFVVKVTFTHSGGNASNTASATAFGSTQSVTTLASGSTATFTFDLPVDWKACDDVEFSIYQEGQSSPMNLSGSYKLYGVCPADRGCETSFTGEAISCGNQREAVYTFTSKDALESFKIQGGLTNFTGADAEVIVTGGNNITQSQWTTGGSSNRVIKVEGNIGACETITIRIKWNSTNTGGIITGSWSVSANGGEVAPAVAGLTCQ